MGWKLNALVFLLAVGALASGSLIIGIPLFAYLIYGLFRRRHQAQEAPPRGLPRVNAAKWLGILLLLISFVALASGGVYSPVVFGALGVVALVYGTKPGALPLAGMAPVRDSILLRDRVFPFRWCAVAELKLVTRDVVKVLSAAGGHLVVRLDGKARAFLIVGASSFGRQRAEEAAASMRELSRILTPLGAYAMPLEAKEALGVVNAAGEKVRLQGDDLAHALATAPYDVLTVRAAGRTVKEMGAFRVSEGHGGSLLKGDSVPEPITLWEVAAIVGKRAKWSEPDELTTFLSSMAATKGATDGERLVSFGDPSSQVLTVRSLKTPPVELSRAQVRALTAVYP